MSEREATAIASANIAFIKYWGNLVPELRLPYNDSLSMNLSAATSTTRVRFDERMARDEVVLDGEEPEGASLARIVAHLDRVRARAGMTTRAAVASTNTFPMGTGIASSASGFAALTVAAASAAGLSLTEAELSVLARHGSGSAARSVPGGFTHWRASPSTDESYAVSIAPPDHWDLRDIVAVVSRDHKAVGSSDGHGLAPTSPFFSSRLADVASRFEVVRSALLARDFETFAEAVEAEALSMHAVQVTSRPSLLYWAPGTVGLLRQVAEWRAAGLPVCFTLDAGPNVHLLCEGRHADDLESEVDRLDYVVFRLHNRPAGAARTLVPDTLDAASGDRATP